MVKTYTFISCAIHKRPKNGKSYRETRLVAASHLESDLLLKASWGWLSERRGSRGQRNPETEKEMGWSRECDQKSSKMKSQSLLLFLESRQACGLGL